MLWSGTISTLGVGYSVLLRDTTSTWGIISTVLVVSLHSTEYPSTVLNILQCTDDIPPRYWKISIVVNILHSTEWYRPQYWTTPTVLNNLHSTAQATPRVGKFCSFALITRIEFQIWKAWKSTRMTVQLTLETQTGGRTLVYEVSNIDLYSKTLAIRVNSYRDA